MSTSSTAPTIQPRTPIQGTLTRKKSPPRFALTHRARRVRDRAALVHSGRDVLSPQDPQDPRRTPEGRLRPQEGRQNPGRRRNRHLDTPEVIARNEPVENGQFNAPVDDASEQVEVFESYVRMQIDSSKGVRLYKVVHCHNVLLEEPEEVDKAPVPRLRPAADPARVLRQQLRRACHPDAERPHRPGSRRARPYGYHDQPALGCGLRAALNPREMLENRLGGLVNVRRPDSIAPLPQNNLNPFVFEVLKQLSADKEESTGISALSKGLNKDAISSRTRKGCWTT
jgi:hypothetical protein